MISKISRDPDVLCLIEYIKNVFYFAVVKNNKHLVNNLEAHCFTIDEELVYENYYNDFGPLNLGCVYRYCRMMNEKMKQFLKKRPVIHYTSIEPKKKANAAFLLGCYGVLYLNLTPREAVKPLYTNGQNYLLVYPRGYFNLRKLD